LNAVSYGYEITEKKLWTQVTSMRVLTCNKSLLKAQRFCKLKHIWRRKKKRDCYSIF